MFAVLIGFTSYWSVFDAAGAEGQARQPAPAARGAAGEARHDHGRRRHGAGRVRRRRTRARAASTPATTRRAASSGTRSATASSTAARRGFERYHDAELIGKNREFTSILDQLRASAQEGDNVVSSLDPAAQRAALDGLGGQPGAVVAIEPKTGKVRALVSEPPYNPNDYPNRFKQLNKDDRLAAARPRHPGPLPAGLDLQGRDRDRGDRQRQVHPRLGDRRARPIEVQGIPLANRRRELRRRSRSPRADQLGQHRLRPGGGEGRHGTIYQYMDRFGFNAKPQIDLPPTSSTTSGVHDSGDLMAPAPRSTSAASRSARSGCGDAAADGRGCGGGRQRRRADAAADLERVVDPDGRVVKRLSPDVQSTG